MESRAGAITATAEHGAATAETAAMNGDTATPEAATVKAASTAAEAATSTAPETAATAMTATVPAPDFNRQSAGDVFRGRRGAGIDQRQCFRALARRGREHQYRGSRKTEAANNAAPRIWNLHHA